MGTPLDLPEPVLIRGANREMDKLNKVSPKNYYTNKLSKEDKIDDIKIVQVNLNKSNSAMQE